MQEKNSPEMNDESLCGQEEERESEQMMWMPICMCLGLSIGMSLGSLLFDNPAIGMCLGLSLGVAVGSAIDAKNRAAGRNDPPRTDAPDGDEENK